MMNTNMKVFGAALTVSILAAWALNHASNVLLASVAASAAAYLLWGHTSALPSGWASNASNGGLR